MYGYKSNCISISDNVGCTKLFEGYTNGYKQMQGLLFPSPDGGTTIPFKISERVRFLKFNPFYPRDTESYNFSDGTKRNTYSMREKYYEGLLDYADETLHDAVSAQIDCDIFEIDGDQFYVRGEDYKPEWDKDGRMNLAQSRIQLRTIGGTIYNRNIII